MCSLGAFFFLGATLESLLSSVQVVLHRMQSLHHELVGYLLVKCVRGYRQPFFGCLHWILLGETVAEESSQPCQALLQPCHHGVLSWHLSCLERLFYLNGHQRNNKLVHTRGHLKLPDCLVAKMRLWTQVLVAILSFFFDASLLLSPFCVDCLCRHAHVARHNEFC